MPGREWSGSCYHACKGHMGSANRVFKNISAILECQYHQLCFGCAIRKKLDQWRLQPWNVILLHPLISTFTFTNIICWGVLVLLKFHWAPDIMEFVLGRFSHFNIAIAYSNSTFCGAWTPSFCEFTQIFSKTSTPLQIKKETANIWECKVGNNANIIHYIFVKTPNRVFPYLTELSWQVLF